LFVEKRISMVGLDRGESFQGTVQETVREETTKKKKELLWGLCPVVRPKGSG